MPRCTDRDVLGDVQAAMNRGVARCTARFRSQGFWIRLGVCTAVHLLCTHEPDALI